jgi:hypothetical protein
MSHSYIIPQLVHPLPHRGHGDDQASLAADQSLRNTTEANQPVRIAIMEVARP